MQLIPTILYMCFRTGTSQDLMVVAYVLMTNISKGGTHHDISHINPGFYWITGNYISSSEAKFKMLGWGHNQEHITS